MEILIVICSILSALAGVKITFELYEAIRRWIRNRFRKSDEDFDFEAQGTYYLG